jgi:hypothetical protein
MRRFQTLLLIILITATLWVFCKLLADDFPFKGWAHIHSTTFIERQAAGYVTLPPLNNYDLDPNHHFSAYAYYSNRGENSWYGYECCDLGFWPEGEPNRGAAGPLPPLIERSRIIALSPKLLFSLLVLGWSGWALMVIRAAPSQGRGFEPLPPQEL